MIISIIMIRYIVSFEIDGNQHHTIGFSSYPTPQQINEKSYSERVALDNAMIFVSGYMEVNRLNGKVNPNSVKYKLEIE